MKITTIPTNDLITILLDMSILIIVLNTSLLFSSCTPTDEKMDQVQQSTHSITCADSLLEFIPDQVDDVCVIGVKI